MSISLPSFCALHHEIWWSGHLQTIPFVKPDFPAIVYGVYTAAASAEACLKYHEPAKKMIHLSVYSSKKLELRYQFKLQRYIEQFHTNNLHTATYGKYGKITFQSFGKVF